MNRGSHHSEESKQKIRNARKLQPPPMLGKHHSEESKKRISSSNQGHETSDVVRRKISLSLKGRTSPVKGMRFPGLGRRRWKDPEYVRSQMIARNRTKQNKAEKLLESLISQFGFSFVGDGQVIIAGKCSDFINEEKHLIIELFGDYWHKLEEVKPREELFGSQGYRTLVIWEHELSDSNLIERKLREFVHE